MNIKSTVNTFTKELLSLIIAFCVGIFIITYLLNLPGLITGNYNIVNEYYIKNFITSIPADFFFVFIYFLTALQLRSFFSNRGSIAEKSFPAPSSCSTKVL